MMRGLFGVLLALAATALLEGPASAHHSQAMFDTTREVLFEGTVVRFDWVNPHMYLIIETRGPDGKPLRVEGEGLAITQARADGLKRDALRPGMRVVMRANPNRDGPGKQVRILDVTTQDGEIHPFYAASTRDRTLKPANSLAGRWAPSRQALGAAFGAMAGWPVTPAGRAAQKNLAADGLCYVEPIPFLAVLDEMRSIEIGKDEVVMHFDNSGDHVVRRIRMNAAHPANVQPSRHGPLGRPVGGRHARDRYDRLRARPLRPWHERAVEHAQAHGRTAHAHGGTHQAALRDHRGRPGVSHQAGHAGTAVGSSPGPRLLAAVGGVRRQGRGTVSRQPAEEVGTGRTPSIRLPPDVSRASQD